MTDLAQRKDELEQRGQAEVLMMDNKLIEEMVKKMEEEFEEELNSQAVKEIKELKLKSARCNNSLIELGEATTVKAGELMAVATTTVTISAESDESEQRVPAEPEQTATPTTVSPKEPSESLTGISGSSGGSA